MVQVAEETGLLLVEAFHYRYHPLFERILSIVQSGVLGPIRHMEGVFKVAIKDKDDLRHRYDTAGGATMDLGCYPLHWMRTVAGTEPRVLSARAEQGAPQVDVVMQAELAFPGGITAHMLTSMADHEKFNTSLRVEGQNGTLIVQNPLAPHNGHELRLQLRGEHRGVGFAAIGEQRDLAHPVERARQRPAAKRGECTLLRADTHTVVELHEHFAGHVVELSIGGGYEGQRTLGRQQHPILRRPVLRLSANRSDRLRNDESENCKREALRLE